MIGLTLADLGLVSEKRENERATIGAAFALFYRNRTGRSPDTHEAWLIARLADALAGADVHMRDSTRRMLNAKYEYQRQALRHGDVATNADLQTFRHRITQWCEQYEAIRQRPWRPSSTREPRTLLGGPPRPALTHFLRAALNPAPSVSGVVEPSLGRSLDLGHWFLGPLGRPADPLVAGLTDLARAEFRAGRWAAAAAVARLARARAPDEVAPQRLLAHASSWSVEGEPPADQQAATHAALGARTGSSGTTSARSSNTGPPLALDGNLPACTRVSPGSGCRGTTTTSGSTACTRCSARRRMSRSASPPARRWRSSAHQPGQAVARSRPSIRFDLAARR